VNKKLSFFSARWPGKCITQAKIVGSRLKMREGASKFSDEAAAIAPICSLLQLHYKNTQKPSCIA
jgi:hypothetical protein